MPNKSSSGANSNIKLDVFLYCPECTIRRHCHVMWEMHPWVNVSHTCVRSRAGSRSMRLDQSLLTRRCLVHLSIAASRSRGLGRVHPRRFLSAANSDLSVMEDDMDDDYGFPLSQIATMPPPLSLRGKHFNCSVHGFMRLDPVCVRFIDVPEFQRLRDLKQLGCAHYVFPTATHSRFDHSLGVCYLANQFAQHILSLQGSELDMDKADVQCVTLAGLCHDLGHGPFSHVFDHELLKSKNISNWSHEDMSCKIFDQILEQMPEGMEGMPGEVDVARIKGMIDHTKVGHNTRERDRYLYDIVANQRNSVDVDKFDYLARDAQHCGVKISFDHKRLMAYSKVLGGEICFKQSEYQTLHELFHSRELMHRQVYTHRKAKSVEFMLVDALMAFDKVFHFDDMLHDASRFVDLDDTIMKQIEKYDKYHRGPLDEEEGAALKAAQAIIRRIRTRQLYRFINEIIVTPQALMEVEKEKVFTAENIIRFYRGGEVRLRADNVIVSTNKINHSMKDQNPLDKIRFFDNFDDTDSRLISRQDASHMMPSAFQEHSLRLYSRDRDPKVCAALTEAFNNWKNRYIGSAYNFVCSTPAKPRPAGISPSEGPSNGAAAAGLAGPSGLVLPQSKRHRSLQGELDSAGLP